MINFFKKLFGNEVVDYKNLVQKGAQIIDVRTVAEFENRHLRNSTNIPLQKLRESLESLDKSKAIITVCASGARSSSAKTILEDAGFEVYNGGGWTHLEKKLT